MLVGRRMLGTAPAVPLESIKRLRQATSAPVAAIKKALQESDLDIAAATALLRARGGATASKRADRLTDHGLVAVRVSENGRRGCVVEMRSETDFVARNTLFRKLVHKKASDLLAEAPVDPGDFNDQLDHATAALGEKIALGQVELAAVPQGGFIQPYVHGETDIEPGMGRIGVLLTLQDDGGGHDAFRRFARPLAMHVAAMAPPFLSHPDPVEEAVQRDAARQAASESGRHGHVLEKIVEGKLRKWREEVCLVHQPFVGSSAEAGRKIGDILAESQISIQTMARVAI